MSTYLTRDGSSLLADTTGELLAAADAIAAAKQLRNRDTPLQRVGDLTPGQARALVGLGAVVITHLQAQLLVDARRVGVAFTLDQAVRDPAGLVDAVIAAAKHQRTMAQPQRRRIPIQQPHLLPAGTVSVLPPARWANPVAIADRSPAAHAAAAQHFTDYLQRNPALAQAGAQLLSGLDLACTCPLEKACHADVWLSLANGRS